MKEPREEMGEMFGSITVCYKGEEIDYVFDAIIDLETNIKKWPSLSFYENYGCVGEQINEIWDVEHYLIEVLYNKVLIPWVENKQVIVSEEFAEVLKVEGVKLDDFSGLLSLFKKVIEYGFFEDYFNKKENGKSS